MQDQYTRLHQEYQSSPQPSTACQCKLLVVLKEITAFFFSMLQHKNDINVEMIDYYLIFHLVKESHREAVLTIPTREFIDSKADYLQL